MSGCVAVINAGSSSIKFALYDADKDLELLFRGQIESIGRNASLKVVNERRDTVMERNWSDGALDHRGAVEEILRVGPKLVSGKAIQAVGHRVVHGGVEFAAPTRIDPHAMQALEKLVPLAPLHQPHNLAAIRIISEAVAAPAADRLLRHGLPPQPASACPILRAAATTVRCGCAAVRLSWAVL